MDHADIVGERYRLDRKIGQGGTGSIWLAYDIRLERRVAIKFLFASDPEHQERLAKRVALEAKIAASVQHPNVVQIFDFGTHDANIPYIVMEALSGFTLGDAFDNNQSFSLDVVIQLMSDVLRGLATVHHVGIVHRDLKPENIFLVKDRDDKLSPKLLDFGISRSLEPETRRSAVTTTEGLIVGTPQYMSPEQARGLRTIDQRTDLYSLGVVLFEALTGFVPFDSENTGDLLTQVVRDPTPPLYDFVPQIGKPLCHVVDHALAKDRNQRFSDAASMHSALVAAARQVPSSLDRSAPLFPPPGIRSRTQAKHSGSSKPGPPHPIISYPTRASRGLKLHGHGARDSAASEKPPPYAASDVTVTITDAAALRGRGLRRWLLVGGVGVALIASAVAATLAWSERHLSQDATGFIVVQASAPPAAPAPARTRAPVAVEEAVVLNTNSEPAPEPKRAGEPKARKPAKAEPVDQLQLMAANVARAFARQKAKVIGCLDAHPEDMQDAPQLTVRVTVSASGSASEAQLLPETIADKPVSGCVRRAVLSMSFPPQAEPTIFRVPLLWRRK